MHHNPHGRKQTLNYSPMLFCDWLSVGLGLPETIRGHECFQSCSMRLPPFSKRALELVVSLEEISVVGGPET